MYGISKRAFQRLESRTRIAFAYYGSDLYFSGAMFNFGPGGMYFETDQALDKGMEIHIVIPDQALDVISTDAGHGYLGEVVRVEQIEEGGKTRYGIGIRFRENVCEQCGEIIDSQDIQRTENCIHLCPECMNQLEFMSDSIRFGFENFLLGNVV